MRVIKDKFGCINPYNEIMAKRKDVTVIENYEADAEVAPKALPKKRRRKKAEPETPAPDGDEEDILNGLDD